MCVAVPMKVRSVQENTAVLESAGVSIEANISLLDNVAPGDYLLIHAGFAIARLSHKEAGEIIDLFSGACGDALVQS